MRRKGGNLRLPPDGLADSRGRPYPGSVTPLTTSAATILVLLSTVWSAAAKPAYTTTPGPNRPDATFVVSYQGDGSYKTTFHATPPNPGSKPDTNDAPDSSKQSWKA